MQLSNFTYVFFWGGAPKLWNGLPESIKTAGSVANFKKMLKTHLFNKLKMVHYTIFSLSLYNIYVIS